MRLEAIEKRIFEVPQISLQGSMNSHHSDSRPFPTSGAFNRGLTAPSLT